MEHYELIIFFLVIAFIYASVGFGGGSSYLAVLALYGFPLAEMKLTALICNIIVVTGGAIIFVKNKQVDWKKILPVVALSVPMAFLGATMKLSENIFFIVLGCSLIAAAMLLWIKTKQGSFDMPQKNNFFRDGAIGGAIGFLSGMVGIGGGIFLSPLLNIFKWDTPKRIAATASVFIFANSVAGIAGQLSTLKTNINYTLILMLGAAVLTGGQLGSRMGAVKFNQLTVKRITAVIVLWAGIEVLMKHL